MAKRSFTRYVEQELGKFPHFVVYAVLEWVLIIILFIDGFLAFFANEFARFFELQLPCLLCTRIDHFLVHRNSDFYYNDSMCESHKKDVSSLAYCHNHKKLSDIRKMCEPCLLSFATEKESDCDTYKSLVGILHKDLECFVEDDHHQIQLSLPSVRTKDESTIIVNQLGGEKSINTNRCTCCGEPLKVKSSYANKGTQHVASASMFSQAPTPSPRALPTPTKSNIENRGLEFPHIRYTELKFNDNDSELPEEEDGSNILNSHSSRLKEDVKAGGSEGEELNEDSNRTPNFIRGNRFFGIPLTDSAQNSPRYGMKITRKSGGLLDNKTESTECIEGGGGGILNEADSDSILNHLKRQVRYDRKSLIDLYMELDEERSASAVAANNAMAMITRLQAEKAAVQMEALQYQRMMEEQAEYDQEALQATNDMLVKREEDIRVLEAELEVYREKYGELKEEELNTTTTTTTCQPGIDDQDSQEFQSLHYSSYNGAPDQSVNSSFSFNQDHIQQETSIEPSIDLKGDKTYLLGRIKNLDTKTHLSENGDHDHDHVHVHDEIGKE